MTIRAYLEPAKKADRRSAARRTLRLAAPGLQGAGVLIRDISAGGMLIESETPLRAGEAISVELPRHGACEAAIVWGSGRYYGCRFAKPLPPAAVSAALLKSAPEEPEWTAAEKGAARAAGGFAEKLTALREARGLSIEQLARRLSISRQALWYWETGKRTPRRSLLKRLAEELGVPTEELASPQAAEALPGIVEACKERIAARCGVSVDQVTIVVEF